MARAALVAALEVTGLYEAVRQSPSETSADVVARVGDVERPNESCSKFLARMISRKKRLIEAFVIPG